MIIDIEQSDPKDIDILEGFADRFNMKIVEYTEEGMIPTSLLKMGAVKCYNLISPSKYSILDFGVDKDGKFVGYCLDGLGTEEEI